MPPFLIKEIKQLYIHKFRLCFCIFGKYKINPMKSYLLILFLLSCCIHQVNSQNLQTFYIPDSLKNKTYKELYKNFNSSYNDSIKEKTYAKAYLHKAKNEEDTIKIANGYSQLASVNNPKIAIKYCDSIIDFTKNMDHFEYPGFGYIAKGISYFSLGNYKKALDSYLIAHKYAVKHNNIEQLLYIKNLIGELKNFLRNYNEALEHFKSILYHLSPQNRSKYQNGESLYLSTLFSISNSYILAKKLDSALIYAKKGIQESLSISDSKQYYNFIAQIGIIAYYQNNFKLALDNLNKAFPYEISHNSLLNHHYYKGNIYWKQNKETQAFYHFKKADSIYELSQDVVPEVRDIQEYFVEYYKKNNDIENQLLYINKLLYVDSIIDNNYKNISKTLIKKYDTPLLLSEKEKIITNLKSKGKKSKNLIYILITLGFLSSSFFIWYYIKQRILKERFKKLISYRKKISPDKKPIKTVNGVSEKIAKKILTALEEFEVKNLYLDNNLTLNNLSKNINTNSNYLSKIVNTYKEKNFSSYISDLRIDYCIEKLKTDTTFRKYTINAIAFEIGFNNVESFSKAFYKKTGIYPSYFIKEINNIK